MLLWLIPLIIFVAVLVFFILDGEPVAGIGFGLLLALCGFLLTLCVALPLTCATPKILTETQTHEVHALVDNIQYEGYVSGNVFLTRGYVNEELKYNYMYMVEGKGFTFESIDADQCYLNKTDKTPYVVVNHYDCNKVISFLFGKHWSCYSEYIFYLPENAEIIDDFSIDFE